MIVAVQPPLLTTQTAMVYFYFTLQGVSSTEMRFWGFGQHDQ